MRRGLNRNGSDLVAPSPFSVLLDFRLDQSFSEGIFANGGLRQKLKQLKFGDKRSQTLTIAYGIKRIA